MVHAPSLVTDVAIIAAGIALQFALAWYIEWYRALVRGGRIPKTVSPEFFGPHLPPSLSPKPVKAEIA